MLKRGFDWCADRFRNRDGIIMQGAGKGLRFNPGRTNAGFLLGTSEPGVQAALVSLLRPGMTFYDVGANVGFLTVIGARLVGPTGRVVSIEPLPGNVQRLQHNVLLNQFKHVTVKELAIGAENTTERFFTSEEPTWGTLASSGRPPSKPTGEIEVQVRTLDSLLHDEMLPCPELIKIDVEGGENSVLLGARETLIRSRPILMIELHGTNSAVAESLRSLGYHSVVLGSSEQVTDASWDAYVVAVHNESLEAADCINRLASSVVERR